MAWIAAHQEMLKHPKTLDLMSRMEWDVDITIGKLHRLWWWCLDYAPDGDLRKHNPERLAFAVGLPKGQADKFMNSLIEAGWLDEDPYLRIHNWWKHVGLFLQRKHTRHPEEWRRVRDLYCTGTNAEDDGYSTDETLQTLYNSRIPPNLTKPDTTKHNITNKTNQPPQRPSAAGAADGAAGAAFSLQEQELESNSTQAASAAPEYDLEQLIYDRIGESRRISRLDMVKIEILRNRHGSAFFDACKSLHPGVKSVVAYLHAILEPAKDSFEDLG